MPTFRCIRNLSLTSALACLIFLNLFWIKNAPLSFATGVIFFLWSASLTGQSFFPDTQKYFKMLYGFLIYISLIMISGAFFYLTYSFDNRIIALLLLAFGFLFSCTSSLKKNHNKKIVREKQRTPLSFRMLVLCFLIFEASLFFILWKSQSIEALRSPWQVVTPEFFLIYFLSTLMLAGISASREKSGVVLALFSLHCFLSLSVALIVYALGYGFDPFIHQATEKIIAQNGAVTPKTPYYIGQYILVVFLSKILGVSVRSVDLVLLPVFFSLFVPQTAYFAFKNIISPDKPAAAAALVFLFLPLNSFIATTPQGFSNAFILITVFLSLIFVYGEKSRWIFPLIILALASVSIHPLSGIPALIFVIFLLLMWVYRKNILPFPQLQKFLIFELFALSSIALPIIFIINSKISKNLSSYITLKTLESAKNIFSSLSFLRLSAENNFDLIYDVMYWYEKNSYLFFLLLSLLGAGILMRKYRLSSTALYLYTFFILFINYFLLRLVIAFPSLIDYERQNYPNRIFEISFYFLSPLLAYLLLFAFVRSEKITRLAKIFILLFLAIFSTSNLYISYPRLDEYKIDKGYNITQSDVNAVHYIDEIANGDYIVLANQMTSVAAVREFGFKKYYPDKKNNLLSHFYYPIPTGDPLYQYYLQMVYEKPSRATAKQAGDFIGVENVYFVLIQYWDKYEQLVEEAKKEATSWQSLDEGKAHVFHYKL